MSAYTRTNQGGSQERAESDTILVMFVVKLSAPLVAAMKALRNTSGVKKPSEDDWLTHSVIEHYLIPIHSRNCCYTCDRLHITFMHHMNTIPCIVVY